MSHTPESIGALDLALSSFRVAHEAIFDLYRDLARLGAADDSVRELLADSTHVVLTEAPTVLADPIALRNRWTDEAVLDSAAADATAAAIADALRTLVPELRSLLRRLQEIAQALKARRDAAGER